MKLTSVKESEIRNKISLILFICSVLVIYIHANNRKSILQSQDSQLIYQIVVGIETYWSNVTRIAVPFFFFISAVLFFRTFTIGNLFAKWKSRFKTIFVPYVIWCSIYYLYYVVATNIPAIHNIMSVHGITTLSLANWINSIFIKEYYTLWFLKNLTVYILLTPIIYFLLKNHSKVFPTGFLALICSLIYFGLIKHCIFDIPINFPSGLDIYMIGAYIGINHKEHINKTNKTLSIISFVIVCCFFLTSFKWFNLPLSVIFFLSCWLSLDLVHITKIYWWMEITFFTYVAHDMLLESFKKVFFLVFSHSPVFSLIGYIFIPLFIESILILVAFFIISYLPVLWRFLCGGRIPFVFDKQNHNNTNL